MAEFVHINNLTELFEFFGLRNPAHPLITVIRQWPLTDQDIKQIKFSSSLYYISLKRDISGSFDYGRNSYDYQEGTMIFIGPGQVATFSPPKPELESTEGWTILFHPDLIAKSELGKNIMSYSFFNYEIGEALHLSDYEKQFLNTLVDKIEQEINQNIDKHSQDIIIQHLQTILKYSNRFYDRQFYLRSNLNKGIVIKFERFLQSYFDSDQLVAEGLPTITQCGNALNLSGTYLSDLLKAETGKSAKDHIYRFLLERAKVSLLNSDRTVSEIAYEFGFEYPQNFSKLFKAKKGMSPSEFRSSN